MAQQNRSSAIAAKAQALINIADIDNLIDRCKKDGPALLKHPQIPLFIAPVAFDTLRILRDQRILFETG